VKTIDALRKARELISDPARWTQGFFAHSKTGRRVDPRGRSAVCWCVLGACDRVAGRSRNANADAQIALHKARPRGYRNVAHYRDRPKRKHADVLALFDRAIAAAERES
jgi:hypothetical protein